jgi:hypothetical protein
MLMNSSWPDGANLVVDQVAEHEMQVLQDLVGAVRQIRNLAGLAERAKLPAMVAAEKDAVRSILSRYAATAQALAHLESMQVEARATRPANSAVSVVGGVEVIVPLGESVDLAKLKDQLLRRADKVKMGIKSCESKLNNAAFIERADPEVVVEERTREERRRLLSLIGGLLGRRFGARGSGGFEPRVAVFAEEDEELVEHIGVEHLGALFGEEVQHLGQLPAFLVGALGGQRIEDLHDAQDASGQ